MAKKKEKKVQTQSKAETAKNTPAPARRIGTAWQMLLLFGVSFALHTLLHILLKKAPIFFIDENLYTNIARSLAWEGKLAFRSQPVNYPYLLYPMALVPVYWLHRLLGGDIYVYVQVFNTALMTSSVFPAFAFAHAFTKDRAKAFAAAVLVAVMPDMVIASCEMSESLIWPLALWMLLFCYRFYTEGRLKDGLLTGLFAGMLFACKPGMIALGAALLLIRLLLSIRDKERILPAVLSLAILAAMAGAVYGVYRLLYQGGGSLLGLYEKQTENWSREDILVAIEAFFLTVFLFVFACGGFFAIFPYTHLGQYGPRKRRFMVAVAVGILALIAGTAVFVVPYQWHSGYLPLPLHLRYCSMCIPMLYVFTLDGQEHLKRSQSCMIALIAFIVLAIYPGARAGFVAGNTTLIDSLTLSAFVQTRNEHSVLTGWLATALAVLLTSMILFCTMRQKPLMGKRERTAFRLANILLIAFMLFNSVCAHACVSFTYDDTISAEAREVNDMIGTDEYLGITQRHYADNHSYWLEGRLNRPMQQVTMDQIFVSTMETDGVYVPFVPMDQKPNVNNHETPDTDKFLLGMTIAEHMELSEYVRRVRKTSHGYFTLIEIDRSQRWVDTMMYGLDANALYPDVTGYIQIYDDSRNIDGYVHLSITASGGGALIVGSERIELGQRAQTYEITVPYMAMIPFNTDGGTVQIYTYSTEKA